MGICASTPKPIEEDVKIPDIHVPVDVNSALVFIKPHANTSAVRELVQSALVGKGLNICQEGEIFGKEIDAGMLIDQHYYAIASKATLLKPQDMPVPIDKFEEFFEVKWATAIDEGVIFNAKDACTYLNVDATGLNDLWKDCKKIKFGGGFYCGIIKVPEKPAIYVFNAFFMTMRSKFVEPTASIHYYIVEFPVTAMKWSVFRGQLLGPTDPAIAPVESLRGKLYKQWESLGLSYIPNVSDNGIHASASPFEGLAERMNWLRSSPEDDKYGTKLIQAGISSDMIKTWSRDPQVKGKSIFDQLEDLDSQPCIQKCLELSS